MTAQISIAEFIERIGLKVFETYTVNYGVCSCRKDADCTSPGKHPKAKDWQAAAKPVAQSLCLLEKVRTGRCNYGIATTGDTFVLDFDGEEGLRTFDYLRSAISKLRSAPRVRTQGGGLHVFVSHGLGDTVTILNKTKHLPDMDVRGKGGYVIGPGSQGLRGLYTIEYSTELIPDLSVADLEALLLLPGMPALPTKHRTLRAEGARNDGTFKALCAMRSLGLSDAQAAHVALGVNAFNSPPLDHDELMIIAESVLRYEQIAPVTLQGKQAAHSGNDEILPMVVDKLRSGNWSGAIKLDEFRDEIVASRWLPFMNEQNGPFRPRRITDFDLAALRDLLTRQLGEAVSTDCICTAIQVVSNENRFHPVKEYLRSLVWDSKQRVTGFLANYFGAANDTYSQLVSRCLLVSMIARVMNPGCQVDTVVVLEGPQGIGKSQGLRALGGEYFGDPCIDPANKDAYQQIHGLWLIEFAELDSLRRRNAATAKAFISTRIDRYRPPYGRVVKDQPRQCVFVGTTNESHYLQDPTGNRRFLPVKVTAVDVDAIADDRDQIFAEAVVLFEAGESWWPEGDEVTLASQQQTERVEVHPWEDVLRQVLIENHPQLDVVAATELFAALGLPESCKDKGKQTILGQIMHNLGFERKKSRKGTSYTRKQDGGVSTYHLHHLIPTSSPESILTEEETDTDLPAPARDNRDQVVHVVQVVTTGTSQDASTDPQTSTDLAGGAP
jgi:putative DNA primase/helicase